MWDCLDVDNSVFEMLIPRIDSIAPLNVAAGVGDISENGIPGVITIYGSGFGTPINGAFRAGMVGFPDAETILPEFPITTFANTFPAELDYVFWSDTLIRVRVPSRNNNTAIDRAQGVATSGKVTVSVNGINAISSQELYVHFGMFNDYQQNSNGVLGAKKRRMSARWKSILPDRQGYILSIDTSVLNTIPNAYMRIEEALDEWRCNMIHPVWIELDTIQSSDINNGINTGFISMSSNLSNVVPATTRSIETHQSCPNISVSNRVRIILNSNFTFVDFPISDPDTVHLKKILVHEFGHAILARHTVNRSIMYPNAFFENLNTLSADDNLCGEHSYKLGQNGAPCEPDTTLVQNLNTGSFDCQTNGIGSNFFSSIDFVIYPNPARDYFILKSNDYKWGQEEQIIRIHDIYGRILYMNNNVKQRIDISKFPSGLYYVQVLQNGLVLGTKKLIHND